ncbi:MAG: AMP-binding protein [Pseudomonadota bacterium]
MTIEHPVTRFSAKAAENPAAPFLHQPMGATWRTYSFEEVDNIARKIASGLLAQGYNKGDRIALMSQNSADWIIVDIAIMMAGMVSVPIYPTAGADTVRHVLRHSKSKAVFLGEIEDETVAEAIDGPLKIALTACKINCELSLESLVNGYELLESIELPRESDLMTIVYTSGSTGTPKGVGLTYRNMVAGAVALGEIFARGPNRVLSYLPLAHVAERSFVAMGAFYNSVEIFFNESLDTFARDLQHANVTAFISVPRLWAKFQTQVFDEIPPDTLQSLLESEQGATVAAKIRDKMGFGNCRVFLSGTAPISASLLRWYYDIGVDIMEGWGMTETSGVACANMPFKNERIGSIGVPVNSVEMRLSDESEILVRGDSILERYYLNPTADEESFVDGWFRTGDCAQLEKDGSWKIIGRVKELFKTAKGKYVAPVPIESELLSNPHAEQVCVVGSGLGQPFALIVLSKHTSEQTGELTASLTRTLEVTNSRLEPHEKLSGLLVVAHPWTVSNELLTPTYKLKRVNIEQYYKSIIDNVLISAVQWEAALKSA